MSEPLTYGGVVSTQITHTPEVLALADEVIE
jgi:hypothetical protein